MTNRPRAIGRKAVEQSALLNAVQFISVAQHSDDKVPTPLQSHCILEDGWALAFDGQLIAAGMPIQEALSICPHTESFTDALRRCGQAFTLTQLDNAKVQVKNQKFRAVVNCLERNTLPTFGPDPIIPGAVVDDRLKAALEVVGVLADAKADRIVKASILVRAGSCVATDTFAMLESWHGLDLPTMTLPKAAAAALCKTGLPIVGFGYSGNTATFHFEGGAWLRTQLYGEKYPDVDRVLNQQSNAWQIPEGFFDAVRAVEPFNNGHVYFGDGELRSHEADGVGAAQLVSGLPKGVRYSAKNLLAMANMKTADFVGKHGVAFFFGDNVRGAVTSIQKSAEEAIAERRAYLASPEGQREMAEREANEVAAREERRKVWQAKHDASPWTPTKHLETFENSDMYDDIPF